MRGEIGCHVVHGIGAGLGDDVADLPPDHVLLVVALFLVLYLEGRVGLVQLVDHGLLELVGESAFQKLAEVEDAILAVQLLVDHLGQLLRAFQVAHEGLAHVDGIDLLVVLEAKLRGLHGDAHAVGAANPEHSVVPGHRRGLVVAVPRRDGGNQVVHAQFEVVECRGGKVDRRVEGKGRKHERFEELCPVAGHLGSVALELKANVGEEVPHHVGRCLVGRDLVVLVDVAHLLVRVAIHEGANLGGLAVVAAGERNVLDFEERVEVLHLAGAGEAGNCYPYCSHLIASY